MEKEFIWALLLGFGSVGTFFASIFAWMLKMMRDCYLRCYHGDRSAARQIGVVEQELALMQERLNSLTDSLLTVARYLEGHGE